jgi:ankyrin repeat protein
MTHEQELIAAIKEADLHAVERLIKEGANINYIDEDQTSYGFTWPLLHHCIFKANSSGNEVYTKMAALLLKKGAKKEAVNFAGETPALFAIKYFAPDIFDLLIQKGCKINAVNNKKQNLFDIVLDRYQHDQQLDMEHIDDEEDKAVKAAIRKGEGQSLTDMFKRIDALVKNRYDLQAGKYSAALCTIFEILQKKLPAKALYYLFDKGADPREYFETADGDTAPLFDYACNMKMPVDILTEMAKRIGVNYVFEEFDDLTPFIMAINNNNLPLVKRLVQLGANIHGQDELPLLTACDMGHQKIVEYLVEQGANINFVDPNDMTPIAYAAQSKHTKIVDYLKSKGAKK